MKSRIWLALGGLALGVPAAGAQNACDNLKSFFAEPPRIGDWAELSMSTKNQKPAVSRISFVGKEQRGGREMYRMQMVMMMEGKPLIMQTLTPWDMSLMTQDHDREGVMKMGDQPAVRMSFPEKQGGAYDPRKECAKTKYVGEETVAVPAGSFKAQHYSWADGDMWVSPKVPGMHMVKMVAKDGSTMILTAVGTGAKNEITEKPMDMDAIMGKMKRQHEGKEDK